METSKGNIFKKFKKFENFFFNFFRIEVEEEDRKRKLQLYVFVAKCIAYHFNAKQPTDMTRRQMKVCFFFAFSNWKIL